MFKLLKNFLLVATVLLLSLFIFCACNDQQECTHEYTETIIAPTCTEVGYTEYKCTKCENTYKDNEVAKIAHVYDMEQVVPPTCTVEGYTAHICSACGNSYNDTATQKVAHPYRSVTIAPSCVSTGKTEHTCTECGDSYTDNITQKIPHNYKSIKISPSCTEEGYTSHTCTECGDSYNDALVEKKPHSYREEIILPICTAEGYTKHICNECGDTYNDNYVESTAHRFNGAPCIYCGIAEPSEVIVPNTEWYNEDCLVFTLTTPQQLAGLAELVNSGIDFADSTVHLGADIELNFAEWIPIGTEQTPFCGEFDGAGYKISNLKINATSSYAGLFGYVNGKITNFIVNGSTVYANDAYENVGIACGYSASEIIYVHVSGFLDAPESKYVGGVVGYTATQLSNCSSTALVQGKEYVGGIAGFASVSSAVFSELYNKGSVSGVDFVGGIIGSAVAINILNADNLENSASIVGSVQVGGIFGYASGKVGSVISLCKSSAAVSGSYYVGGLIGKADNVTLSDSFNDASSITASSYLNTNDLYYAYLGGYVGYGYIIENCVNNANITYTSRGSCVGGIAGYLTSGASFCSNYGNISGFDKVGGIAGELTTTESATVTELYNYGNISGKKYVAGIIGSYLPSHIVSIFDIENKGNIYGKNDVGGIVGNLTSSNAASIYNLKNSGNIEAGEHHAGGLFGYIGKVNSMLVKDSSSSADIRGAYYVGGLIGRSDNVELQYSSNEGSTVTATGWLVDGTNNYVNLGGYVGYGYKVTSCENNSDINYEGVGYYVGGVIGFVIGNVQNCSNNGNIMSASSYVGGIAGRFDSNTNYNLTYSDLSNSGSICGINYVGGIAGGILQSVSAGQKARGSTNLITTIANIKNSGSIMGDEFVGGLAGNIYLDNYYYYVQTGSFHHEGFSYANAKNFENSGLVSGKTKCGEFAGSFWSDKGSTLSTYSVLGAIEISDEYLEGTYDVGSNYNLTLNGREIYAESSNENSSSDSTEEN